MWSRLHWSIRLLIIVGVLVGSFFLLVPVFEWMERFLDPGGAVGFLGVPATTAPLG